MPLRRKARRICSQHGGRRCDSSTAHHVPTTSAQIRDTLSIRRRHRRVHRTRTSRSRMALLAQSSPTIAEPHLNACLGQLRPTSQLLARIDVRILGAFEGSLQLVQLVGRKGGSRTALLALQGDAWFAVAVG